MIALILTALPATAQRGGGVDAALKSNLLFDAAALPNLELEVALAPYWSLAGEYLFAWWLSHRRQDCLELMAGTLELRRWLGYRPEYLPLTGLFVGLHAAAGGYDIERRTWGYQGEFVAAGLSGGYAHTVGRSGRWRMEYSLGAGWLATRYRAYVPRMDAQGQWCLTHQRSGTFWWMGPLRARVSLVWMIGKEEHGTAR